MSAEIDISNTKLDNINELLEKLIADKDFETIDRIYNSADELIRSDIVCFLEDYTDMSETEKFLLGKINDKYRIVRCDIYDALSVSDSEEIFRTVLKRLTKEKSYIAMSYLLMYIGSVCRRNPKFKKYVNTDRIIEYYSKEYHETALPSYLSCLYVLTKNKDFLNEFWQYIDFEEDYHVRCSAANQVYELADKQNCKRIYKKFKKRLEKEDTVAVSSSIEEALRYLEEEFVVE